MSDNLKSKIKQYGILHFLRRGFLALVRWAIVYEKYVVLEGIASDRSLNIASQIIQIDRHNFPRHVEEKVISPQDARMFEQRLARGECGVGFVEEGRLVGSAWLQLDGIYEIGNGIAVQIPAGVAVMKNLLVSPMWRGKSIGKKLNEARVALVPGGSYAIVFIIFDNVYALRNWKLLGFKPALSISVVKITGLRRWISVRVLNDSSAVRMVSNSIFPCVDL